MHFVLELRVRRPESVNEFLGIEMVQKALRSNKLRAVCALGIASTAVDSFVGLEKFSHNDFDGSASSALHIGIELLATSALLKLRKLEPNIEFIIEREAPTPLPLLIQAPV